MVKYYTLKFLYQNGKVLYIFKFLYKMVKYYILKFLYQNGKVGITYLNSFIKMVKFDTSSNSFIKMVMYLILQFYFIKMKEKIESF